MENIMWWNYCNCNNCSNIN